jgi:hypothetical protein
MMLNVRRALIGCAAASAVAGFIVFSVSAMVIYFVFDREVRRNILGRV